MFVKGKNTIKLFLIIFIGIAVYMGHQRFFNSIPGKIRDIVPDVKESEEKKIEQLDSATEGEGSEMKNFKFSSGDKNSLMGNVVSGTLNKVLENPKGRLVVKEVLQKMMRQSHEIAGHDLFLSRYLAHDIVVGEGRKAMCGDTVEILYTIKFPEDSSQKKEELKKVITIGKGELSINLESGIVGMKEGGKRTIGYPNLNSKDYKSDSQKEEKSNAISASVKLLSIVNKSADKEKEKLGKPFFDKIGEKYSSGIKLICGDDVKGSYSLSDLKGTVLYDSEKAGKTFSFKIGEDKVPLELSNALLGLSAYKAKVSFITSPPSIKKAFSEFKDFIPEKVFKKETSQPVILYFKLSLLNKIPYLPKIERNKK